MSSPGRVPGRSDARPGGERTGLVSRQRRQARQRLTQLLQLQRQHNRPRPPRLPRRPRGRPLPHRNQALRRRRRPPPHRRRPRRRHRRRRPPPHRRRPRRRHPFHPPTRPILPNRHRPRAAWSSIATRSRARPARSQPGRTSGSASISPTALGRRWTTTPSAHGLRRRANSRRAGRTRLSRLRSLSATATTSTSRSLARTACGSPSTSVMARPPCSVGQSS